MRTGLRGFRRDPKTSVQSGMTASVAIVQNVLPIPAIWTLDADTEPLPQVTSARNTRQNEGRKSEGKEVTIRSIAQEGRETRHTTLNVKSINHFILFTRNSLTDR